MADTIDVDLIVEAVSKGFSKLGQDVSKLGGDMEKQTPKAKSFGQQASAAIDLEHQLALNKIKRAQAKKASANGGK